MTRVITKGQKINDRYEIIKSIGEGGMANVYLGQDTILDRKVAIKILRGDLANDEKFIRRFQREALSASSLSHPNIVEMYDVGEDNGNYYIVMEYIEGKTVKQLLKKRGKLTVSEAVDIMLQLTEGMAEAHDSYIIHRDIKPQNIMIREDGTIKITDFGIAMALNSTQLTQTNSVMGSVHYLPPEQASGKGCTIKSDIYSMGILFYELLTGNLPFKGDNAVEIALKHLKEPIPSVRKQNPSIPQSIENIILKATAKNPKNRYNDVKEMNRDLRICLDPEVMNQAKINYKYPEHETDEKEIIPTLKSKNRDKEREKRREELKDEGEVVVEVEESTPEEEKKVSKSKVIIWILLITLVLLIGVLAIIFVPAFFGKSKEVTIPDVSGMSVEDAIEVLQNANLNVNDKIEDMISVEYKEGQVVKTDPLAGRKVKTKTIITLYRSTGDQKYTIEDYTGKNYREVKTELEKVYGLVVEIEKQEVKNAEGLDAEVILEQSPKEGAEVQKGDKVILYIPDIFEVYPDFTDGSYSVEQVQDFCDTYGITLVVEEKVNEARKEGEIYYQSRKADSQITSGATLKIYVAKKAPKTNNNTNNSTNNNNNNDNDNTNNSDNNSNNDNNDNTTNDGA